MLVAAYGRVEGPYTAETPIVEVRDDAALGNAGRLLFPVNEGYMSGSILGSMSLTWYSTLDPAMTVDVCNYVRGQALAGETIFLDIYSDAEKAADPWKTGTGLYFFRGEPGAPTAIVSAGGGFAYVGAMHDSFPHCMELARRGYNACALIYRPSAQIEVFPGLPHGFGIGAGTIAEGWPDYAVTFWENQR